MKKLFFTVLLALFAVGAQAQDFGEYYQNENDYTWDVEGDGGTIKCYYHYIDKALVIQPKVAGNSCAMKNYGNSRNSKFINETKEYYIGNGYVSLVDLISTVDIKEGITNIGSYCFAGKTNIRELVLPNSVTSINSNAFAYTGLNMVSGNINANIHVADDAFTNTSLIDEQGLLYFGNVLVKAYSNYLNGGETVEVKSGTTKINPRAFEGYEMGEVTIPSSVTSIEDGTFMNCTSLKDVSFNGSVSSIGTYAFSGCTSLKDVSFNGSVSSIGTEAFSGCAALTSINIPNTVETWGSNIFSGCTSLPIVDGYQKAGNNVIVKVDEDAKNRSFHDLSGISYIAEEAFKGVSGKVECFGSIPMAAGTAFKGFDGLVFVNDGDEAEAISKLQVDPSKINHYTIEVSKAEFSTVSLPFCSDVSTLTGVTVYRAVEDADAGLIKLTKVDKMDKEHGYVVYRQGGGIVTFTPNGSLYTEVNPNQMVGCDDGDVVSGADKYVLSLNSEGEVEFQCLDLNSATIPAGKSYFQSNSDTPLKSLRTAFDNTTGIEDVYEGKTSQKKSGIYSLSGQRLSQARKGLNIINGQVVLK